MFQFEEPEPYELEDGGDEDLPLLLPELIGMEGAAAAAEELMLMLILILMLMPFPEPDLSLLGVIIEAGAEAEEL